MDSDEAIKEAIQVELTKLHQKMLMFQQKIEHNEEILKKKPIYAEEILLSNEHFYMQIDKIKKMLDNYEYPYK